MDPRNDDDWALYKQERIRDRNRRISKGLIERAEQGVYERTVFYTFLTIFILPFVIYGFVCFVDLLP